MRTEVLWVTAPNKIEIGPEELSSPESNELQIETKAVGICAWDSYLYRGMDVPGPFPYRIGHEGVGVVINKGRDVKGFNIGDKVFAGTGGDKMMARHFNVAYDCVAKIPHDEIDYSKWVGEPVVCVVNILNMAKIQPGDSIALIGAGYMGLLTLQGLVSGSQSGEINVFDVEEDRLNIARKYLPNNCFNPSTKKGLERILEIQLKGGANVVIEFAGTQSSLDLATSMTANEEGKLVIGSWHRGSRSFNGTRWHTTGLQVLNLAPKSNSHFKYLTPRAATLINKGVYDTKDLVTHVARFDEIETINDIFKKSIKKTDGYIKGVILF